MHQPVTPLLDPISTSSDVVGGVLSSTPTSKFLSTQISGKFTPDSMIDLPFFGCEFSISNSNTFDSTVLSYDPWFKLWNGAGVGITPVPYPIVALQACYFYDFDIELTFLAIKHERARGIYSIVWSPGLQDATGNYSLLDTLFQKWIWDIEKSDTFSVTLKSVKTSVWRDRKPRYVSEDSPLYAPWIVRPLLSQNLLYSGILQVKTHSSYNAGSVGPDTASVIVFHRLINMRNAEYRPPYSLNETEIPFAFNGPTPT